MLLIMSFEELAKRGICGAGSCIADRELEREMNHFEISWREEKGKYDKSGTKESERGECDLTRGDLFAKLSKDPREVQGEGSRRCLAKGCKLDGGEIWLRSPGEFIPIPGSTTPP